MKLAVLALFGLALSAQTGITNSSEFFETTLVHASRTVEAPGHFYIVEYAYSTRFSTVTAAYCSGPDNCNKAHYNATIKVFEIVSGARVQIGPERRGQYTVEGCFEDDPLALIEVALSESKAAAIDGFHQWREAEKSRKAFESMPLYELSMPLYEFADGVLRITDRGKRDIKAITVNDRAIWGTPPLGSTTAGSVSYVTDITDNGPWMSIRSPAIKLRPDDVRYVGPDSKAKEPKK